MNVVMPLYIRGINEPYISKMHERFLHLLYTVRRHFSNGKDRNFLYPLQEKGRTFYIFWDANLDNTWMNIIRKSHLTACRLRCAFRLQSWVKLFLHTLQEKGFSPLCILRCNVRLGRWENLYLHISQKNSFSPVWTLRCLYRLHCWMNFLLHNSQEKACSPVWIMRCIIRKERREKLILHTSQETFFSLLCTARCVFTYEEKINDFLHTLQEKGQFPSLHSNMRP
jgi:hypothetical protein